MDYFYLSWGISALTLLLLAGWIGKQARFYSGETTVWGILIDVRERISLNRFQLVMWTLLILSNFLGVLFCSLSDPGRALSIPAELLGLLGISIASATITGAVKDYKNAARPLKIAGGKGFRQRFQIAANDPDAPSPRPWRFAQVFLEEEGTLGDNDVVSVTKFQNFVFTLALGIIYLALACKAHGYPVFDEKVLWLVGISHGGYIGGKLPDKA